MADSQPAPAWPFQVSIPATDFDAGAQLDLAVIGDACRWDRAAIARTLVAAGVRDDDAHELAHYAAEAHRGLGMAAADALPLHLRARLI